MDDRKRDSLSARQQVYSFLNLPHHQQVERARNLGLILESDAGSDEALRLMWIRRAVEKNCAVELLTGEAASLSLESTRQPSGAESREPQPDDANKAFAALWAKLPPIEPEVLAANKAICHIWFNDGFRLGFEAARVSRETAQAPLEDQWLEFCNNYKSGVLVTKATTKKLCMEFAEFALAGETASSTPTEPRFVVIADGEGASAVLINGDLHQSIHNVMCCCGSGWEKCETEFVSEDIRRIDDPDNWIIDESGVTFSISWEYETGRTTLYTLGPVPQSKPRPIRRSRDVDR